MTEDRRIKRTKNSIKDAFAELLISKPLNKISVREISELADINRGTFYLHYKDVYDLAEKLQEEIFDSFNEIVDKNEPKSKSDAIFPLLVNLLNLLSDNSKLVKVFISKNGYPAFNDKLIVTLKEKCFKNAKTIFGTAENKDIEYLYDYMVFGAIGIFSNWIMNDMKESPTDVARYTEKLIITSLKGSSKFINTSQESAFGTRLQRSGFFEV